MHPDYLVIQAIMEDRLRFAESRRAAKAARAARPPRTSRRAARTTRRWSARRGGEAA